MKTSETMKGAPRYLALRYGALSSYVWESLFPKDYRGRVLSKIKSESERKDKYAKMKSLADEASMLVFIFVLKRIFNEGSEAAKRTVDLLKEMDINEFYLGSTKFTERNENVVLGDMLAEELLSSLDDKMRNLISGSYYISNIIDEYQKIKKNI